MKMIKWIILLLNTIYSFSGFTSVETPLKNSGILTKPVNSQNVVQVKTARVFYVNYELIQKDFPHLQGLKEAQIDQWLIDQVGYISEPQTRQSVVNTPISTSTNMKQALRPFSYGRALVFEVPGQGLIEGKGFGAVAPSQKDHGNGLGTLGEMIREVLFEQLVQRVLEHSGSSYRTIGNYAIIDWGFDMVHEDGSRSRAGAILRQAHTRYSDNKGQISFNTQVAIEKILRTYGITSIGATLNKSVEAMNIQGSTQFDLVDFGAFLVTEEFTKDVYNLWGTQLAFKSHQVEADPQLRIPYKIWGTTVAKVMDPKSDNPWIWSHELAENFAQGKAKREHMLMHLQNFLSPVDNKLKTYPNLLTCRRVLLKKASVKSIIQN